MTVPISKWKWFGHAGHLIVASKCRFHLHTRVGNYRISTVGDYYPREHERETIGADRFYETFVFPLLPNVDCDEPGCGCGVVDDWMEIDSEGANDFVTATELHMQMCRKYAKKSDD